MSVVFNLRFLAVVIFTIVFIVLFYYYNDSLDTIVALERDKTKCQQGVDTLSAQLQVVYEHKSRLEKTLQQEKENLLRYKTEQERLVTSLRQAAEKLRKQYNEMKTEKDKLAASHDELKRSKDEAIAEKDGKIFHAQKSNKQLQQQIDDLTQRIETLIIEKRQYQQSALVNESKNRKSPTAKNQAGAEVQQNSLSQLQQNSLSHIDSPSSSLFNGTLENFPAPLHKNPENVLQRPDENLNIIDSQKIRKEAPKFKDGSKNGEHKKGEVLNSADEKNDQVVFERRVANLDEKNGVLPPPVFNRPFEKKTDEDKAAEKHEKDFDDEGLPPPKNFGDAEQADQIDAQENLINEENEQM